MEITFLGTSCAIPTKERSHVSFLLRYGNEGILFDCGEGVQRQIRIAGINPNVITKILLTHWHGDHSIGIIGLLETLNMGNKEKKVVVYGPLGTVEKIGMLKKVFGLHGNYEVIEAKGRFFENDDFFLEAADMSHGVPCLGYSFIEKDKIRIEMSKVKKSGLNEGPMIGKLQKGEKIRIKGKEIKPEDVGSIKKGRKLSYITDTTMNSNAVKLAYKSDILVCESSFASDLEEKAEEFLHMTAKQAAFLATKADVKKLVLTHFSQRYKSIGEIEQDAKNYFGDVVCAYDFMKLKL